MFKLFLIGIAGLLGYGIGRAQAIGMGVDFFIIRYVNGGIEYLKTNPDGTFTFVADENLATKMDGWTALRLRQMVKQLATDNIPVRVASNYEAIVSHHTSTTP